MCVVCLVQWQASHCRPFSTSRHLCRSFGYFSSLLLIHSFWFFFSTENIIWKIQLLSISWKWAKRPMQRTINRNDTKNKCSKITNFINAHAPTHLHTLTTHMLAFVETSRTFTLNSKNKMCWQNDPYEYDNVSAENWRCALASLCDRTRMHSWITFCSITCTLQRMFYDTSVPMAYYATTRTS